MISFQGQHSCPIQRSNLGGDKFKVMTLHVHAFWIAMSAATGLLISAMLRIHPDPVLCTAVVGISHVILLVNNVCGVFPHCSLCFSNVNCEKTFPVLGSIPTFLIYFHGVMHGPMLLRQSCLHNHACGLPRGFRYYLEKPQIPQSLLMILNEKIQNGKE